jgi:hypothetical protein
MTCRFVDGCILLENEKEPPYHLIQRFVFRIAYHPFVVSNGKNNSFTNFYSMLAPSKPIPYDAIAIVVINRDGTNFGFV